MRGEELLMKVSLLTFKLFSCSYITLLTGTVENIFFLNSMSKFVMFQIKTLLYKKLCSLFFPFSVLAFVLLLY